MQTTSDINDVAYGAGTYVAVGNSGLIRVFNDPLATPEIAVEQPVNTNIADGGSKVFGSVNLGSNTAFTFTIKNTGAANLTGLSITKDGNNTADFTVGSLGSTTVTAGGCTTVTVTFAPSAAGTRNAAIHIASNDADENPFDIALSGTGLTTQEGWRQTHFGTISNLGDAANTSDPDRDGLNNLLEFAFDLNPLVNSAHLVPRFQRSGNDLTCTFTQPAGITGITYSAEWSSTLQPGSWTVISNAATPPTYSFIWPLAGKSRVFTRLKVISP